MPKRVLYDGIVQVVVVLIHVILPIPIYFAKRKEEKHDIEQRAESTDHNTNEEFNQHMKKYFSELIFNYIIIVLILLGYGFSLELHRYILFDFVQGLQEQRALFDLLFTG